MMRLEIAPLPALSRPPPDGNDNHFVDVDSHGCTKPKTSLGRHVYEPPADMSARSRCWQDKDIHDAKLQVQGQLAAQYIQEVMQVRGRSALAYRQCVCTHQLMGLCAALARRKSPTSASSAV